jgi:hypothetical protein
MTMLGSTVLWSGVAGLLGPVDVSAGVASVACGFSSAAVNVREASLGVPEVVYYDVIVRTDRV